MASNQINKQHINIIDFLRGLAALMVVFVHYFAFSPTQSIIKNIAIYGQHGVIIFFVISGFIIPYSLYLSNYCIRNYPQFIIRRILRLNPPYYIVLLITIIILLIAPHNNIKGDTTEVLINIKSVFYHLTYLIPFTKNHWFNNIFWTLSIELQYYILIAFFYPILRLNKGLSIFLMTLFCFSHYLLKLPFSPPGITILNYSTSFILSMLLFIFKTKTISYKELVLLSIFFLFLCKEQITGIRMLFALVPFIFILFIDLKSIITDFFGRISYSLYLTHTIVYQVMYEIFKGAINFEIPFMQEKFTLFIVFPLSILVAYQFYILVEKPSINLAKKVN